MGDLGLILGLGRYPGEGGQLPTPVFWPGEFHGLYSPRGRKESNITEKLSSSSSIFIEINTFAFSLEPLHFLFSGVHSEDQ